MGIPRALDPTGVVLVDKPAGPTSFDLVARLRRRTGARTGHAGTLDPFATGLLILLSGRATRAQERFLRLDKRYVTEIDLRSRTTTGDPDGDPLDDHEPPDEATLLAALERVRGVVELPVPAASAVKIDGERAYRLHRRGVAVEMPTRPMRVRALDLLVYEDGVASLALDVGSGTYVRSIADALGGHCASLRRTSIGPFEVGEADEQAMLSLDDALERVDAFVAARAATDEAAAR